MALDFPDFLIASRDPNRSNIATAIKDYFPIEGARATFAEARRIFDVLEVGESHGLLRVRRYARLGRSARREATYRWFAKSLQDRQDEARKPIHGG
jgi:hypothetical protein